MGLDMYLLAKRKNSSGESGITGACGGLFPIAPRTDKEEIGYGRKAYDLQDKIFEVLGPLDVDDPNCKELELNIDQVEDLWFFCNNMCNDPNTDESDLYKYEEGVESFAKAREILREDPENKVYYMCWY